MNVTVNLLDISSKISLSTELSYIIYSVNIFSGFHVCLGRDGKRYDDLKYCWLQGRQVNSIEN